MKHTVPLVVQVESIRSTYFFFYYLISKSIFLRLLEYYFVFMVLLLRFFGLFLLFIRVFTASLSLVAYLYFLLCDFLRVLFLRVMAVAYEFGSLEVLSNE